MQHKQSSGRTLPSMPILSMSSIALPDQAKSPPPPGPGKALLRGLRRRWPLALSLALLAGVTLSGMVWTKLREQYRAEACLHVPLPATLLHDEEVTRFRRSHTTLAQSPPVLATALRQPEVTQLPVVAEQTSPLLWLQGRLAVEAVPSQDLLRIQVHAEASDVAACLTRAVATAYLHEAEGQRQKALEEEQEACRQARAQIAAHREQLTRWENNAPRMTLERDLQQANLSLRATQIELAQVKKRSEAQVPSEPTEQALLDALRNDPEQQHALRELAELDEQIRKVQRVSALGANDPLVSGMQARREKVQQQIEANKQQLRQRLREKLRSEHRAGQQAQLSRLQEQLELWQKLHREIQAQLNKYGPEGNEQQRRALQDEIRVDAAALQKREAELATALKGQPISWPEEAVTVRVEGRSLRWLATTGAGLAGVMLMLLLVGWGEAQRRQVTAASQVTHGLGLRVLARVPAASAQVRAASLRSDGKEHNPVAEAIDALRTVLLCDGDEAPQVILVTSAGPHEGKTSLAAGLAASLARGWRKTLLIDGHLRKPEAHTLLGVPLEPGLSELLRDEVELGDVIQTTTLGRLWMISAGHGDAHAIQSLAQPAIAALFEQLRQQFDCIVIDAGPALGIADALMLSRHADVAVLAARSGVSHLAAMQAARQQIAGLNVLTPGVVLLGRDEDMQGVPAPEARGS